jgi:hypothetical protein
MTEQDKTNASEKALQALTDLEELQSADDWPADAIIDGYRLFCTCPACPEQYDVFDSNNTKVGYLRLRHGWFRADYPECGVETIYEAHPIGDGSFVKHERVGYLTAAVRALDARIKKETPNGQT